MVAKLVRPPPIQRLTQKGIWQAVAASRMISCAWLLSADEEDFFTGSNGLFDESICFFKERVSLLQIDDGDAVAVSVNVWLGLWIPAAKLVAEVNACVEKVFWCYIHDISLKPQDKSSGRNEGFLCDY